jgi:hypothetical protein
MRVFRLWANAASSTQPIPEAHISNAATSFACSRPLCPVKFKPMKLLLCLLSPFVICHSVFASDPVRIYLANDDHTDYMWTADADTYGRVFVEMLDYHLKLTDETMGNPSPYQNRFNADGSLWLWEYERRKTPAEFARLVARIKSGHLSAPLNAAVPATARNRPKRCCVACITPAASNAATAFDFRRPSRWKTSPFRSGWLRYGREPGPSSVGGVSVVARAK